MTMFNVTYIDNVSDDHAGLEIVCDNDELSVADALIPALKLDHAQNFDLTSITRVNKFTFAFIAKCSDYTVVGFIMSA